MERGSRSRVSGKGSLEELLRERVRGIIEIIVEQELEEALGAASSARVGTQRSGYRHGHRARTLSTSLGATSIALPRARIAGEDGKRHEWRSQIVPRYQRRTEQVDEAMLGVYLSGTNTRRLRGALAPLLHGTPLSKDAVSRLVGRLREDFAAWAKRDLGALQVRYLFFGRLVSAGPDRQEASAGAGIGHFGSMRGRAAGDFGPAAGRSRKRTRLARCGALAGRA
jgi:putative transposase